MPNQSTLEILLSDPLGKVARQERNRLLVTSLIGLAVAKAHILPTKISSLGIDFSGANQRAFVVLLALAVLYFLLAFAIYGLMDVFLSLAIARKAQREAYIRAAELEMSASESQRYRATLAQERRPIVNWRLISVPLFYFRAVLFDFLFPCVLGIVAIVLLFRAH
jgi:hypothetical protein